MSFHPNDVVRRARGAAFLVSGIILFLVGAFFRTQIVRNQQWVLQSEENRLREVPLPAPRGIIYDRNGNVIAENVVGYSVSLLTQREDSLKATLQRLGTIIDVSNRDIDAAVRRYRRDRSRPTVIIPDASFDVVSVLEEHRIDFPNLIIQSAPKRYYPDGPAVASLVGYIGEISESDLADPKYAGYKAGQQIGKQGLEKQYEAQLRGREGSRFVEVDARNRVVREAGAREDLLPIAAPPLYTNIDLDLQRYAASLFGDTLQGGVVALDPKTGGVLALYSAPSWDPNRFIGGVPIAYYDSLRSDSRNPLYNKALQGTFPPGSTWKLATSVIGIENNLVSIDSHMPEACTGGMYFGNRYWRCWQKRGHGSLSLGQAIAQSCDVYFYQLGLKIGITRLIAGGVSLDFTSRTGIDLPEERRPTFPDQREYFNEKYGPRGWTEGGVVMNLSIGQGENAQTVLNMARFYTALAEDGSAVTPSVARRPVQRSRIMTLTPQQLDQLRGALAAVAQAGGTAAASQIQGVVMGGKTGTAQTRHFANGKELYDAWFVGFAPVNDPKIVVAVVIEYVPFEGATTARIAAKIIEHYLKVVPIDAVQTEG